MTRSNELDRSPATSAVFVLFLSILRPMIQNSVLGPVCFTGRGPQDARPFGDGAATAAESAKRHATEFRAGIARAAVKLSGEHARLAGKFGRRRTGSQPSGEGLGCPYTPYIPAETTIRPWHSGVAHAQEKAPETADVYRSKRRTAPDLANGGDGLRAGGDRLEVRGPAQRRAGNRGSVLSADHGGIGTQSPFPTALQRSPLV